MEMRRKKKKRRWKICFVCVPSAGAAEEENSHSGYTALIKSSGLLVACQNQVGQCYWGIVIFSSLNSANLSRVLWAQQKSLPACQLFGFKPGREESELRFYLYWEFTVLSASWSEDGCSPQLLWMGAMVLSAFRAADEWLQEKVLICFLCLFLLVYIGDIRGLNTPGSFFLIFFFFFKARAVLLCRAQWLRQSGRNPCSHLFSKDGVWSSFSGCVSEWKQWHGCVHHCLFLGYVLGVFRCLHGTWGLNAGTLLPQ